MGTAKWLPTCGEQQLGSAAQRHPAATSILTTLTTSLPHEPVAIMQLMPNKASTRVKELKNIQRDTDAN